MWILYIILISIILFLNYLLNKKKEENFKIQEKNKRIEKDRQTILNEYNSFKKEYERQEQENKKIDRAFDNYTSAKAYYDKLLDDYRNNLDEAYKKVEDEYDDDLWVLGNSYDNFQDDILRQMKVQKEELQKLKDTRTAVTAAFLKEEKIKQQKEFYCLRLSVEDEKDIDLLRSIRSHLSNPRVLDMLIWSSFYQKPMNALCNNILGTNTIIGIYKITNQITGQCYIGQSNDISKRWKDHAKCGLGIDTPASNKLYKAMEEYGLDSFSWELIEKCKKEELNEKERYYIDLYDSCNYGYNSNKGIGKK